MYYHILNWDSIWFNLLGGGFGGKETRFSPLTTAIAVAANK